MREKIPTLILAAAGFFCAVGLLAGSPRDKKKQDATDDPKPLVKKVVAPAAVMMQKIAHMPTIFVHRDEIMLYVTVTDNRQRVITGLGKDNFEVFDEKVPQKIVGFFTEDAPISVCIVLDASGSLGDKLQLSLAAIREFSTHANPQDEYMLVVFGDTKERQGPQLVVVPTANSQALQDRLLSLEKAEGKTPLLDAVYFGLDLLKKNSTLSRRVLLLISDGGDNHSRYTDKDVKDFLKETDAQIECIGIFEPLAYRSRSPEEAAGPGLLAALADMSGGRMFSMDFQRQLGSTTVFMNPQEQEQELKDIADNISFSLRNQYVLTYKPSNLVKDGRWRRVKVKLNLPKGALPSAAELPLQIYVREGYYAPSQ